MNPKQIHKEEKKENECWRCHKEKIFSSRFHICQECIKELEKIGREYGDPHLAYDLMNDE